MISLFNPGDLALVLVGYWVAFVIVLAIYLLGHYALARLNNVAVASVSLGFGKELLARNDARGTRWRLCRVPLGGYVSFAINDSTIGSQRLFDSLPVWRRASVIVAGPAVGLTLTFALLAGLYFFNGASDFEPVIGTVVAGGPAEQAGLKSGDRVIEINGMIISGWTAMQRQITAAQQAKALAVAIERSGSRQLLSIVPRTTTEADGLGGKVQVNSIGILRHSNQSAVWRPPFDAEFALRRGWDETIVILQSVVQGMLNLVTGRTGLAQTGGFFTLALLLGFTAKAGLVAYLHAVALFSTLNAVLNMLPWPPLNGGHLLILGLEAVRRKPLGARSSEFAFRVGTVLLLLLCLALLTADYLRISALLRVR